MSTYIICEIGQNHNGNLEMAKRLIDMASMPIIDKFTGNELKKANAVKFTKRDLNQELSASQMNKPYDNPNSFAKTYGEHRAFLELSEEDHHELYKYAKDREMDFIETLCATGCLSILNLFTPDKLKVASRDLTNIPLLEALSETEIPIILSTGMSGEKELDTALETITKYHDDVTILHCISEYPAKYKNINLNTIRYLKNKYTDYVIGYSDHSIGIMIPIAAVALGANIIEKHVTLDRNLKGSDHSGSLEPEGVWRMVRDIRNLEAALGEEDMYESQASRKAKQKLERSIATKRKLKQGEVIKEDDLFMLSPGDGYKWDDLSSIVGKKVKKEIPANEIIYSFHIE